jgi:TPR repeat protein
VSGRRGPMLGGGGRRAATGLAWARALAAPASAASSVFVASVPKMWRQQRQDAAGQHDAAGRPGSALLWAERLVRPEVLAAARAVLKAAEFDRDADTVDGSPTFELLWAQRGEYVHKELAEVFRSTVEAELLPVLRGVSELHSHGDARELVLCEALVRVYADGQRRVHPAHYDTDALVTAVLEVDLGDDPSGSRGFEGPGFYVQPGAHVASRIAVPLAPGDVVAHSFDLQHGVEVTAGRRCSVIMWFADSKAACLDKSRSWCSAAADAGDADAQYVLAGQLDKGRADLVAPQPRVLALLRAAARQGHFCSQHYLGHVLLQWADAAVGSPPSQRLDHTAEAVGWLEASAGQGFHKAMVSLARHYATQGDSHASLRWLTSAAEQRADPAVMHELWLRCSDVTSTPSARQEQPPPQQECDGGREWLERAAEMGYPASQHAMGRIELRQGRKPEAEAWLRKASDHGVHQASVELAMWYAQSARPLDALRVLGKAYRCWSKPSSKQLAASIANKSWVKVNLGAD